jgi:hypothetical protein
VKIGFPFARQLSSKTGLSGDILGFSMLLSQLSCTPVLTDYFNGVPGETYNIGGNNEVKNIDLVQMLCRAISF